MHDAIACVLVIIATLVFVYMALKLYAQGKIGGSESLLQKFDNAFQKIKQSTRWREYIYVFVTSHIFLLRGALGAFLTCLVTIVSLMIVGASPCVSEETLFGQIARDAWDTVGRPWLERMAPEPSS